MGDELVVKTRREILVFDNDGTARSGETISAPVDYEIGNAFGYNDSDGFVYLLHSTSSVTPPSACSSFVADLKLFHKSGAAAPSELTLDDCEDISDIEIKPGGKLVYVYQGYGAASGWRLKQRSTSGTTDFDVSLTSLSGYTVATTDIYNIDTLTMSGGGGVYVKRQVTASPSGSLTDTDIRVDSFDNSGAATTIFNTSDLDDSGAQEVRAKMRTLGLAIAGDSLFVPYCMNLCDVASTGYVVKVDESVGFDYPRSSAIAAHPQLNYVALGDSFSSGEGVEPFIAGTDTSTNQCHRSEKAYAMLLDADESTGLNLQGFRACSGAKVEDVQGQLDSLSEATDIVTITIGGNDIGFKDFATACVLSSCGMSSSAYEDAIDAIYDTDFQDELLELYKDVVDATAGTTQIYVVGYPYLTPEIGPTNTVCWPFNEAANNPDPETGDAAGAHAVVEALNSVIHTAVNNVEVSQYAGNVHYVDPNASGSPFSGHDWCSQDSYFDAVQLPSTEYSFHPKADGQVAYFSLIKDEI